MVMVNFSSPSTSSSSGNVNVALAVVVLAGMVRDIFRTGGRSAYSAGLPALAVGATLNLTGVFHNLSAGHTLKVISTVPPSATRVADTVGFILHPGSSSHAVISRELMSIPL